MWRCLHRTNLHHLMATLQFVNGQLLFDPNDPDSLAYTEEDCKCCRCCQDCKFNCETTIDDYYEIVWQNDSFYGPVPYTRYTGTGGVVGNTSGIEDDPKCDFCIELETWSYIGPLPWVAGDELIESNWSLTGTVTPKYWISYALCGWRTQVTENIAGFTCKYGWGTCSGTVSILCGDPYGTGLGVTGEFTVNNPSCDPVSP